MTASITVIVKDAMGSGQILLNCENAHNMKFTGGTTFAVLLQMSRCPYATTD